MKRCTQTQQQCNGKEKWREFNLENVQENDNNRIGFVFDTHSPTNA